MADPIYFVSDHPAVEEQGGTFTVSLPSGKGSIVVAMSPFLLMLLCHLGEQRVTEWQGRQQSAVQPFPVGPKTGRAR